VAEGVWEAGIRKNTSTKTLGSYYRSPEKICPKKRENLFFIKNQKRESTSICG